MGIPTKKDDIKKDDIKIEETFQLALKRAYDTTSILKSKKTMKLAYDNIQYLRTVIAEKKEAPVYFVKGPLDAFDALEYLKKIKRPSQEGLDKYLKKHQTKKATIKIDYDVCYLVYWVYNYRYGLDNYFSEEWKDFPDFKDYCEKIIDTNVVHGLINADDFTIAIDKPKEIHVNETGHLHCETGPAILYRDGSCAYFINSYKMPSWLFKKPKNEIDLKKVINI